MVDFDSVLFCIWGLRHGIRFPSLGLLWYRLLGVDVLMKNPGVDGQYTPKLLKLLWKSSLITSAVWCDCSHADLTWSQYLGHCMAILDFLCFPPPSCEALRKGVFQTGSHSLAQGHNRYLNDISWLSGWNSIAGFTHSNSATCSRNLSPETVWDGLLV